MEPSKDQYFDIVAGNEELIQEVIERYNRQYKTDFKVVEFDDRDHVLFAVIKFTKGSLYDVFQMGSFFGMLVQDKRHKKEVDF